MASAKKIETVLGMANGRLKKTLALGLSEDILGARVATIKDILCEELEVNPEDVTLTDNGFILTPKVAGLSVSMHIGKESGNPCYKIGEGRSATYLPLDPVKRQRVIDSYKALVAKCDSMTDDDFLAILRNASEDTMNQKPADLHTYAVAYAALTTVNA